MFLSALYTIITFPFLFAIMFGDTGHGIILFLFGLFMVVQEEKIQAIKAKGEIANIFFGGRYIILLMGLFSIYTGFVYNDVFSLSMNIFQSSWTINYSNDTAWDNEHLQLNPTTDYSDTPYFIGLDPAWQVSDRNIFNNALIHGPLWRKPEYSSRQLDSSEHVTSGPLNKDAFGTQTPIFTLFLIAKFWAVLSDMCENMSDNA